MSATRDFDGIISSWLDQMPDRVSDRVVGDVLQAVAATPQMRRPRFGFLWRPEMNKLVLGAATIALGIALIGGAILLGGRNTPSPTRSPSPSSSTTAPSSAPAIPSAAAAIVAPTNASPTLEAVPAVLQTSWMGAPLAGGGTDIGVMLTLGPSSFALSPPNQTTDTIAHGPLASSNGQLLVGNSTFFRCTDDNPGSYSWTLSPSGRVLALAVANDSCAGRAEAIPGAYWTRGCIDPNTNCLGELDPGTYSSQFIRALPAPVWQPMFGSVTYTVPSGWANYADWPGWLGLTSSQAFSATTADNTFPVESVDVLSDAKPLAAPCSDNSGNGNPNARDLLRTLTGNVTASSPTAISVDGNAGYFVDVDPVSGSASPPSPQDTCANGGSYFYAGGSSQGLDPGEKNRLIALDMPGGTVLGILIRSQSSNFDSFVTAAMPIVQSMTFK